jgi:hypothetical protein
MTCHVHCRAAFSKEIFEVFIVITMKFNGLTDITPFSMVDVNYPEDGCSKLLENIGKVLCDCISINL